MEEYVRYFYPGSDDCEKLDDYGEDGLPPVDLGDRFCDDRYVVIHKLGQGGSATVWLAQDVNESRYVAIKTLAAWVESDELNIQKHLISLDSIRTHPRISTMLDNFEFDTPNGHHVGLVYEMAGPDLEKILERYKIRPDYARKLARNLVEAVSHLHKNNIAYGDLSNSNILLKYRDLSSNNREQLLELLGEPQTKPVTTLPGMEEYRHHGPKQQVVPLRYDGMGLDLLSPDITIIDMNDATFQDSPSLSPEDQSFGVHLNVAAPEYIFGLTQRHTKQSDIWSLACCIFAIRASEDLIPVGLFSDPGITGISIQFLLGPLPSSWIAKVQNAENEDRPEIPFISATEYQEGQNGDEPLNATLEQRIQSIGQWLPWVTMTEAQRREYLLENEAWKLDNPHSEQLIKIPGPPPAKLSVAEQNDFRDLLSKMLQLESDQRLTIEEVLEHPWLNTNYNDLDNYSDWICPYDRGQQMKTKDNKLKEESESTDDKVKEESESTDDKLKEESESKNVEADHLAQQRDTSEAAEESGSVKDDQDDGKDSEQFPVSRLLGIPIPTDALEEVSVTSYHAKAPVLSVSGPRSDGTNKGKEAKFIDKSVSRTTAFEQEDLSVKDRDMKPEKKSISNAEEGGVSLGDIPTDALALEDTDGDINSTQEASNLKDMNGVRASGRSSGGEGDEAERFLSDKKRTKDARPPLKLNCIDESVPWWHGVMCIGVVLAVYGVQRLLRKMYQ